MLAPPLAPMIARLATALPPTGPAGFAIEPKYDGWRALAFRTAETVTAETVLLQSRQQRPLGGYFPEIVAAVAALDRELVLDGELVVYRGGHPDFSALQQRIQPEAVPSGRSVTPEAPGYIVFDLLALDGHDLRSEPYRARRARLEQLLAGVSPPVTLAAMTTDVAVARSWLADVPTGIEGVLVKDLEEPYRCGQATGWWKIETRMTVEAVVGGVLGRLTAPSALVVGRPDNAGRLRIAGRTTALPPVDSHELAARLRPVDEQHPHPWPARIPSALFGQHPSRSLSYTRVVPELVVDLDLGTAPERGRGHPTTRYSRFRLDLTPHDLMPCQHRAQ